jgi:[acyl-carrier-protein] S-malonyltransferase
VPYAVTFPGQGAAVPGAGEAWREHPSWRVVEEAEAVLERPLARLLLEAGEDELATTEASQLAVLLTSLVTWDAFSAHIGDDGNQPVAFAGHSLGQITALLAAGAVDRTGGLRLAERRAALTQRSADVHHGRMAALLGADIDAAEKACVGADAWVANDNAPGQVVIAGTPDGLDQASEQARAAGIRRVKVLAVGHAFHTPLLADAADGLRPLLDTLTWTTPRAPVVSNTDGVAYDGADGWPDRLVRHLVEPVRWLACQHTLAGLGVDTVVELGPGRVLTGLARRTIPDVQALSAATPEQVADVVRQLDPPERPEPGSHLPSPPEDPT